MKGDIQRRKFLNEAALAGAVTVISLLIVAGVFYFYTTVEEDLGVVERDVRSFNNQHVALSKQFTKARNSIRLYESIVQNNNKEDFSLNYELAANTLNDLNERFQLSDLSLSISPIRELKSASMQNTSSVVIYREVVLKFKGISDELILGFVNRIAERFLGYVNITEFSMTKEKDIDGEVLYAVSKGKRPATVSGSMKFLWLGLRLDEADKKSAP